MKVSDLGEFGLINLLAEIVNSSRDDQLPSWRQLKIGIGDDAAAWRCDAPIQLATVDALVQNVHFSLDTTPWYDLGWKSLAVNLSDIAAMGGLPRYALVSLALPGNTEVEDVAALYRGMVELAKQHDVAIVGGDTDSAPTVAITMTVLGVADENRILRRSGAKVGELVAVTGYLGGAAAGLKMLAEQLEFDCETVASLREAFLRPNARIAEGQVLMEEGVRAAIDISDGLVSDLRHICKMSNVGARINIDRVPVHPAVKDNFRKEALMLALSGGEDYELLFTASDEAIGRVRKKVSCTVTTIGEIVPEGVGKVTLVDKKGKPFDPGRGGWEHFKDK